MLLLLFWLWLFLFLWVFGSGAAASLLFFVSFVVSQTNILPHFSGNFNGTAMMGTITTTVYNGNIAWDNLNPGSRLLSVTHLTKPLSSDTTVLSFVAGNKSFVNYVVTNGKCSRSAGDNIPPNPCPEPTFSASTWKGKACQAGTTTCTQSGFTTVTTIYMTDTEGLLASRSKTSISGQQLVSEIDYYDQKVTANPDSVFAVPSSCPASSAALAHHTSSHVNGLAQHITNIHHMLASSSQ